MKLVSFSIISNDAQKKVTVVVGVYQGKPVLVVKKKNNKQWVLYQNYDQSDLNKKKFNKVGSVTSLKEVLDYFQYKGLKPFCPMPKKQSTPGQPASRRPVKMRNKRQYWRKQVNLNGEYRNSRTSDSGDILVRDVSFGGMKFICIGPNHIQIGDKLLVSFTLDDAKKSLIKRKALVRHVDVNSIGVEFINPPAYDKELGFHLWGSDR